MGPLLSENEVLQTPNPYRACSSFKLDRLVFCNHSFWINELLPNPMIPKTL